jgi:hypothetical protein
MRTVKILSSVIPTMAMLWASPVALTQKYTPTLIPMALSFWPMAVVPISVSARSPAAVMHWVWATVVSKDNSRWPQKKKYA